MDRSYKHTLTKFYIYKYFAWFHMFSAILIPFFTQWAKLSVFQFMILESWCMLCMLLLEVPTGGIADYFGRRVSIILGLLIQAFGFAIYVSLPNFYIYMMGEALVALGFSLISGAEEAFIYDTIKSYDKETDSKKVFGRAESFGLAGIMTAAPLGSLIAQNWDLHYPLLLMFIPLGIAFFIMMTMKEPKVERLAKENRSYFETMKKGVSVFYKNQVLRILALDLVVITTMGFLMIWLYQMMLKAAGVNLLFFGIVNTLLIVFEILLLNSYTKIEKLLKSKKRLITLSSLLIGIMFILGALTQWIPVVLTVIFVVGSFGMTRRTLMVNYMNKFISSEERATALSSVSMLLSLCKMISFPIVGWIIEKISLNVALATLGIITILFTFISKVKEDHLEG